MVGHHFDILGSTRAVTQAATIAESHDYDPWGLENASPRAGERDEGGVQREGAADVAGAGAGANGFAAVFTTESGPMVPQGTGPRPTTRGAAVNNVFINNS